MIQASDDTYIVDIQDENPRHVWQHNTFTTHLRYEGCATAAVAHTGARARCPGDRRAHRRRHGRSNARRNRYSDLD